MDLVRRHLFLIIANLGYVAGFGIYYFAIQNYEFLWYVAVLLFFFFLIGLTLQKTRFPPWLLWMLSLWGLLHMAGGGVVIDGKVLYTFEIVHLFGAGDAYVLKFDQAVHFYGFFTTTFVAHHLLKPYCSRPDATMVLFLAAVASMGFGALNELVEFLAVVVAPKTGVGGYYNTALDLVFNGLGATLAFAILAARRSSDG
jgi:putative membrane protein